MPTYEFKCPEGHLFEKFYPTITNQRRAKCPKCGKPAQRLISGGAGLLFKGSGFYITDYKRAGEKAGSSEGDAKPAEAPKPEKKKKDSSSSDK
jgi:putative FmdB family regulatory protein